MGLFDWLFGPPSRDRFARRLIKALQHAGEKNPINYDPEKYRLQVGGESENLMNLSNIYEEWCAASASQRQTIFNNAVRTWFSHRRELPQSFEDVQHDVLPGVRSRMLFELTGMRMKVQGKEKFDWPYRPLGDWLGAGLVYDLPESMMQVQQHTLDGWQTTFDEAFEVACNNLREVSKNPMERLAAGVWSSPWRDNYDASRMLLTDFLRNHDLRGDPVVMVPNRDTLLLAGSDDADGLGRLVAAAEKAFDHPRSISGIAFHLEGEDWLPFLPDPDHPQFSKFKLLWVKTAGSDYGDQAEVLNALHEKTNRDIYVAKFSAVQKPETGEVRSYCVWSEGVVSFLPETDDIFFFRPKTDDDGDIVARAPWERVREIAGDLMKPVGIYPERYLVDDFPSEPQLAALAQG
jgi:hypothetical protein